MQKMKHRGFVLWFTGLSGAGKTAIAKELHTKLKKRGMNVAWIDGDAVRHILSPHEGYSRAERAIHLKRVGYIVSLLSQHGVGVIATFVSPYRKERDMIRRTARNFIEVYVDTPLEICEERDVKGLYKKARAGKISDFTGISDAYEPPRKPKLVLTGDKPKKHIKDLAEAAEKYLIAKMRKVS